MFFRRQPGPRVYRRGISRKYPARGVSGRRFTLDVWKAYQDYFPDAGGQGRVH